MTSTAETRQNCLRVMIIFVSQCMKISQKHDESRNIKNFVKTLISRACLHRSVVALATPSISEEVSESAAYLICSRQDEHQTLSDIHRSNRFSSECRKCDPPWCDCSHFQPSSHHFLLKDFINTLTDAWLTSGWFPH